MSATISPPTSGTFAGMTEAQMRAALATCQTALVDLTTGGKPISVSYSQGDGQRMVVYGKANEQGLRNLIRELNAALGQGGRRAVAVAFR